MAPYILNVSKAMFTQIRKAISIVILMAFISTSIKSPAYAQVVDPMPHMSMPGVMVHLSPEFTPAYLKGIVIHPDNALKFDFIIYKGDKELTDFKKKEEYTKLTKYFLASLAIPDDDQWVNLSPYEKDRIIKDDFGKTEMGRDLLAQDYMLKQITASLIYPEDNLGKKFWNKVYFEAQKQYGTTNIPVNTFNKVWILPDDALIYEKGNTAYVLRNHLKVMLEEDYLSLHKHAGIQSAPVNKTHTIASKIVKEIVLPELEREVNEGKNFAALRQVYSGMLLATWYKRALKESLLSKIYANKAKVKGVDQDPKTNEQIYRQYLRAYKKGVFNFIKEDVDKYTNETIPRKYFSGGTRGYLAKDVHVKSYLTPEQNSAMTTELESPKYDYAEISAEVKAEVVKPSQPVSAFVNQPKKLYYHSTNLLNTFLMVLEGKFTQGFIGSYQVAQEYHGVSQGTSRMLEDVNPELNQLSRLLNLPGVNLKKYQGELQSGYTFGFDLNDDELAKYFEVYGNSWTLRENRLPVSNLGEGFKNSMIQRLQLFTEKVWTENKSNVSEQERKEAIAMVMDNVRKKLSSDAAMSGQNISVNRAVDRAAISKIPELANIMAITEPVREFPSFAAWPGEVDKIKQFLRGVHNGPFNQDSYKGVLDSVRIAIRDWVFAEEGFVSCGNGWFVKASAVNVRVKVLGEIHANSRYREIIKAMDDPHLTHVGLELPGSVQTRIDNYLQGRIDISSLNDFGNWAVEIIRVAKIKGKKVVAMEPSDEQVKDWLSENSKMRTLPPMVIAVVMSPFRDKISAEKVQRILRNDPSSKFVILRGDLHINAILANINGVSDKAAISQQRISHSTILSGIADKTNPLGGIDLNSANLNLQIKRDGKGVPLPIDQQNLDNIHIDGLIPVLLRIKPVTETPLLSELQSSQTPQLASVS